LLEQIAGVSAADILTNDLATNIYMAASISAALVPGIIAE
jgi:hypothetical protein